MAETVIGALSVKITADTKGVQDGIKASGKALKLGGQQLRENANKWGKWAVAATAAAAGVAAAILKSNLSSIRELKNTADAAGTQVAAFQRGAFAAEQLGISTEKYGTILLDTNDRIGDFLVSGAGPMVDFFEQIAPKVGITADAFKGLSGQESLGLYIKSLQEAGVSQQEMTFFMEALASDSTRLVPLFQDNAKSFNALTKEAEALGVGLSDIDVAKAELASEELSKATGVIESMTKQATVELAPIITAVTNEFVEMAKNAGGASAFIKKGIGGVVTVIGVFADGLHGIDVIFKGLELAAVGFSALAAKVFAGIINIQAGAVDFFTENINKMIKMSNKFLGTDFGVIPALKNSEFVKSVNETADKMVGLVEETTKEFNEKALAPLPSEGIKTFVDEAVEQYEKLAVAKAKASGDAKESADGKGVGEKKTSEIELVEAETIGLLEAMGLRYQSQEEQQLEHLNVEYEQLKAAKARGEMTLEEFKAKEIEILQSSEDVKRQMTLQGIQDGFQVLAGGSKKVQKAMEIAAKTQAGIKGVQAAVDAWQFGMAAGGPWTAAAYSVASLAKTGALIKSIGKGSSPSMSSGGFSVPDGGGGQAQQQQAAPQQQTKRSIDVNFRGSGVMSMDAVRELMGQINEALGDGAELNVPGV